MSDFTSYDPQIYESKNAILTELGRWNTSQGHRGNRLGGPTIKGLIVADPNYGGLTFQALFPLYDEHGLHPDSLEYYVVDYTRKSSIGCGGALFIAGEAYQNNPQSFAAAINGILRPGVIVEWTFFEQPFRSGPQRNLRFEWDFAVGPPDSNALNNSNALWLPDEKAVAFQYGGVIEVWSLQVLKMDPIIAYNSNWMAIAYICSHEAWIETTPKGTSETFKYMLARHPI